MRMGTWDKQLQGPHGRNRSQARLKGGRKGRPRLVELEGLESRTLLATIPAAAAVGGAAGPRGAGPRPGRRECQRCEHPGGGRPDRSFQGDRGLGQQRPVHARRYQQRHRRRPGGGVLGQWRRQLAGDAGRAGLKRPVRLPVVRPDDVRVDGPLPIRDRPQPGVRPQRQLLYLRPSTTIPRRPPALPAARSCFRNTASPGPSRPSRTSRRTSRPRALTPVRLRT